MKLRISRETLTRKTRARARRWASAIGAVSCLVTAQAWAGNETSGGGTGIVLSDDRVILADPYVRLTAADQASQCSEGHRGTLAEPLQEELKSLGKLMLRYGAAGVSSSDSWPAEGANFIAQTVLNRDTVYCFVDNLPREDMHLDVALPDGGRTEALAYTEGRITWIRKDLFKRMPLGEQALLIIHERLHGIGGGIPHGPIIQTTRGLKLARELLSRQQNGDRSTLSSEQVATLESLVTGMETLGLRLPARGESELALAPSQYRITPRGGGWIHQRTQVAPTAFVGVASAVGEATRVGDHVALIGTFFCTTAPTDLIANFIHFTYDTRLERLGRTTNLSIGAGATLVNSWIGICSRESVIGENARIENTLITLWNVTSSLEPRHRLRIGRDSVLKNVEILGPRWLELGARTLLRNVELGFAAMPHSWDFTVAFQMEDGAGLLNFPQGHLRGLEGGWNLFHDRDHPQLVIAGDRTFDFQGQSVYHRYFARRDGAIQLYHSGVRGIQRMQRMDDFKNLYW